jgi:hypothetical protein
MKLDITRGLAVAALGLAAMACSGESAPPPPATTATQPAAAPATTSMAGAVAAGDFGVPACDQYMRKYLACVDSKVPEAARGMMKQSFEQSKAAWKQAASTPEGRAGLVSACTQAEATAKQAMAAYGCAW